jgi:hypothetical protein
MIVVVVRRRGTMLAAGGLLLVVAMWARAAQGFCRTTTCSLIGCVPPECLRDDAGSDAECASACPPSRCRATDADGCLAKGIPIFWEQRCLSFSVESIGSPALGLGHVDLVPVVESAFGLWSAAVCEGGSPAITVTNLDTLTCNLPEYNRTGPNANGIIFRDDSWPYGTEVMGLTKVSFNPRTGEMRDADIQINTRDYAVEFTPEGLAYTIAHESGHFLGLDHSPAGEALMYSRSSAGIRMAPALSADDTAAICATYPPSLGAPMCDPDPRAGDFEPAKGFAPDCGGDVTAACALAPGRIDDAPTSVALVIIVGATAVAAGRRRRRRHPRPADPST